MAKNKYSKMKLFFGEDEIAEITEITSYETVDIESENIMKRIFAKAMFYISKFRN